MARDNVWPPVEGYFEGKKTFSFSDRRKNYRVPKIGTFQARQQCVRKINVFEVGIELATSEKDRYMDLCCVLSKSDVYSGTGGVLNLRYFLLDLPLRFSKIITGEGGGGGAGCPKFFSQQNPCSSCFEARSGDQDVEVPLLNQQFHASFRFWGPSCPQYFFDTFHNHTSHHRLSAEMKQRRTLLRLSLNLHSGRARPR